VAGCPTFRRAVGSTRSRWAPIPTASPPRPLTPRWLVHGYIDCFVNNALADHDRELDTALAAIGAHSGRAPR